ncbi:hypothetical protein K439DRAFT_810748 [Ramaria rubella]|nr:hypothetical protein K439DRAFT_810748 [Ramaria rubella]
MPRRPRKQPRTPNGTNASRKAPTPSKNADGKMKKWVRSEDIEGDDLDKFHSTRDRILLEGEDFEGEEEWGDGEEEVFGLGLDDESEDDEETDGEGDALSQEDVEESTSAVPGKSKKTKKSAKKTDSSSLPSGSDSEESESWGRTKSAYYASNAGLLADKEGEEDEEEANEMEEQEARRLQTRMRDTMVDEDFGLDYVVDLVADDAMLEDGEFAAVSSSTVVPTVPTLPLDKASTIRHLEKTSPETLALAREWDDIVRDLVRVQRRLDNVESNTPDPMSLGLSHLHHQILLAYVTTVAFFLHLRATSPMQPHNQATSRVKSVLERLLTLKQALSTMEELAFDASDDEDSEDSDVSSLDDDDKAEIERIFGTSRPKYSLREDMDGVAGRKKKLGLGEMDALLQEADAALEDETQSNAKKTKKTKTKLVNGGEKNSPGRLQSDSAPSSSAFDLIEPEFVPSKRTSSRIDDNGVEAYGEATVLSMTDDADKKARKRSLRFHTNKIETSARRREEGREKLGGDDDIPYRERQKEKEARVRRELERKRGQGGDDLDGEVDDEVGLEKVTASPASGKRKRLDANDHDVLSGEEDEDGYYELVKRAKKEKKEVKKREYDEARLEESRMEVDDATSGPRSLTRAILKNKGLTPRRAKSVRNPRVKKRERFEKAKKKVRSQKAVYKGGLAGKPYGGEESGISKVVKSVKF